MNTIDTLDTLAQRHGTQTIGALQANTAFSAVASGGTGMIKFVVAAGHPYKKGMDFYVASGIYAGFHRVRKVDTLGVYVNFEFTVTGTGNLVRSVAQDGKGFIVDVATSLVIDEFVPVDPTIDAVAVKARSYAIGTRVPIPFKKLRVSGADVTAVRGVPQADLSYDRSNSQERNTRPQLVSAVVTDAAPTALVLTYTGSVLDGLRIPTIGKFVLTGIASTPTISSITVTPSTGKIQLNLSGAVVEADTPHLVYTKSTIARSNSIQDIWGHLADSFELDAENQVVD